MYTVGVTDSGVSTAVWVEVWRLNELVVAECSDQCSQQSSGSSKISSDCGRGTEFKHDSALVESEKPDWRAKSGKSNN